MHKKYNIPKLPGGITRNNRKFLDLLNRKLKNPFNISQASQVLKMNFLKTKRLLAYWASHGWLTRIRRGLYITVPLGAINPLERREDPWIIAAYIFNPGYIGGWSACEHWEFTDQIFKDIVVLTSKKIRKRKIRIQNNIFIIKTIRKDKIFGTKIIWRGNTKVGISDPTRTIIDILNFPSIGGGMRHISDIISQYFENKNRDDNKILDYIEKIGNRTIYKRLGYIIETLDIKALEVLKICRARISKGYSTFDPTISKKGCIIRKWNLIVNVNISSKGKPQ